MNKHLELVDHLFTLMFVKRFNRELKQSISKSISEMKM
jgi:hypothetical protein